MKRANSTKIADEPRLGIVGPSVKPTPLVNSRRFDWIMVIVSIWWLGGVFVDGWAHSNLTQLETFFLFYFINLDVLGPSISGNHIVWSIPFRAGSPVIAGITGFLLSYVMLPSAKPAMTKPEI